MSSHNESTSASSTITAPAGTREKAELLGSLHIAGNPLIVTNVWDAITARTVADTEGVKALASASHSVSFAHGVSDGEGLTVDQAIAAAKIIIDAVDLPVSIDFEKGYAKDAAGVKENVARLIGVGAAGINIEDSVGEAKAPTFPIEVAAARVAAARAAADEAGVPLVINARVDTLAGGGEWDDAVARANAYLDAGADVIFFLGLGTEELVTRALSEVHGKISVIGLPDGVPLEKLAELGVARVSFGPQSLGLTLSHLRDAAKQLTARGAFPKELAFDF